MYSYVSPDPIGIALAYVTLALAVFGGTLALFIAGVSLVSSSSFGRRYRQRGRRVEPAPAPPTTEPEQAPTPGPSLA